MKCPNCKTEMKKGNLLNHGSRWTDRWADKGYKAGIFVSLIRAELVIAYKCPNCKKIELVTE